MRPATFGRIVSILLHARQAANVNAPPEHEVQVSLKISDIVELIQFLTAIGPSIPEPLTLAEIEREAKRLREKILGH